MINTPTGSGARTDGYEIRTAAARKGIPCITTMTGASAAARAIAAQRERRRPEVRSLQELHEAARAAAAEAPRRAGDGASGGRRAGSAAPSARLAPFGRRRAEVVANAPRAATGSSRPSTRAARCRARAVLHAGRRARLGRGRRAALPAARLLGRRGRRATATGCGSTSWSRPSGPGTERARRRSSRARACWVTGPLGGRSRRRAELSPAPRGRSSSAAASGSRRWRSGAASSPAAGVPQRVLLGFRDREHSGRPRSSSAAREVRLASEDGHAGHRGYVTDLLAVLLEGDDAAAAAVYACGPPAMLEAVRAMCAERGVAAELAMESPMACGFGACFGCAVPLRRGGYMRLCVDGPVVARRGDRDRAGRRGRERVPPQ